MRRGQTAATFQDRGNQTMWCKWLWGLTFAGYAVAAPAQQGGPLVVIGHAPQLARGTLPRDGAWSGLYCVAQDCELRPATVSITESSARNALDEDEALDVLGVEGDPLALFHDVPLKPGKVATWYEASENPEGSRQYTSLKRLGRWQMPGGEQRLSLSWVKLPDEGGYRYFVGDGKQKQFLFETAVEGHYGGDKTPIVHWVGDLDGDGKTDFLLSLPDDNCGYDQRLYLSSQAVTGELVHRAALLSGSEAACGC